MVDETGDNDPVKVIAQVAQGLRASFEHSDSRRGTLERGLDHESIVRNGSWGL